MIGPIGGYFELEKTGNGGNFPQSDGLKLNTGRNALEYILSAIGDIELVYVPYYTCEVILEPFTKLGIEYKMYTIDSNLEIERPITLSDNEYLLYTNYFGIKDAYIESLAELYGSQLIVDNAQALYTRAIHGIKTIYSPRKYVGIPDGGIAYVDDIPDSIQFEIDDSSDRMSHLLIRLEKGPQAGYGEFKNNSQKLIMQPIKRMSRETSDLIDHIDFDEISVVRRRNFKLLHEALKSTNKLCVPDMVSFECPMVYPYWTSDESLKSRLIENEIFIATYWPNVLEWTSPDSLEYDITNNLLPIPCDQRYNEVGMNSILEIICK